LCLNSVAEIFPRARISIFTAALASAPMPKSRIRRWSCFAESNSNQNVTGYDEVRASEPTSPRQKCRGFERMDALPLSICLGKLISR
jgi:hypothetical protein